MGMVELPIAGCYVKHTAERCRDALKAQRDEARRELAVDAIQIEQLKIMVNAEGQRLAFERAEAAEKRAAEAECARDEYLRHCESYGKAIDLHNKAAALALEALANASARLAEAERERDEAQRIEVAARAMRDEYRSTWEDEYARAERLRTALDVIAAREWDRGRDRSVQIALAALAQSADATETGAKTSRDYATRVRRFSETTGRLRGGNRHHDRCVCQEKEVGTFADTPHVHYGKPPFSCARCECEAYEPAVVDALETKDGP